MMFRISKSTPATISSSLLRCFPFLTAILFVLLDLPIYQAGIPVPEQFFHSQKIDHINRTGSRYENQTYTQRYYTYSRHFQGPGHPIFVILGGEGHIPPSTGIFYPFIAEDLAKQFGAYVLQPEHRFYGKSQPLDGRSGINDETSDDIDPKVELFTSEQALYDAVFLLTDIKKELECSATDKTSNEYCPVITVGGSYPGFLSALARIMFFEYVDGAYAASAPMLFYSQQVNQYDYYNHITRVIEKTLTGCSYAVKHALSDVKQHILQGNYNETIFGICEGTTPKYIQTNQMLVDELMMVIGYTFANANMANYPPSNQTTLYKSCETFANQKTGSSFQKVRTFLVDRLSHKGTNNKTCWNMTSQLPTGPKATISSGDWSGVGTGPDGESWDFQTCTREVEAIGFSDESMFPERLWSLDWLTKHCQQRFGVTPTPDAMVNQWKFRAENLVDSNVTRILFTNGLNDGWSVGGFANNLSDSLPVVNFPNGAHHSDLSHRGPSEDDTEDIKQGFKLITNVIATWLLEIGEDNSVTVGSRDGGDKEIATSSL